ncbi:sigma factor-like helix-turn-helix DNA-binding protein [Caldalkalibacillus salinus]|uniref:sigma factor-like helix-turn-helix DNA-binding protein n=1 Tax=Caldalkalibacillus salinus TaxID=2803787 RepID=UPI0019227197|nr:sigma factor-like helix-turn-helix DNA-binding protein [Caldalkalibacillus salinus]
MTVLAKNKTSRYREIEYHLRQFRQYKVGMSNLKSQVELILPRTTSSYEKREGQHHVNWSRSSTEDCVMERLESQKVKALEQEIQKYQIIVHSIEQSLKELDEMERQFVQYRYFQRWTIRKISLELGYSESSVHALRRQLLNKLDISLKGILSL